MSHIAQPPPRHYQAHSYLSHPPPPHHQQSPRPFSPPATPSPPADPNSHQPTTSSYDKFVPAGHAKVTTSSHAMSTSASLETPQPTPPTRPAMMSRSSSSSTTVAGIGIAFPADANPLPQELSGELDAKIENGGGGGGWPGAGPSTYRPRTTSPRPDSLYIPGAASGYASSVGYSHAGGPRERVVSPTVRQFYDRTPSPSDLENGTPPDYDYSGRGRHHSHDDGRHGDSDGGKYSPPPEEHPSAIQSMAYHYVQNPYSSSHDPTTRSRSPYVNPSPVGPNPPGYGQRYPLTAGGGGDLGYGSSSEPTRPAPREKFTDSSAYWLGLYFCFNLGLTLFNKVVLVSFPFPYTLTGLHALSGCAGCYLALERGAFVPARLTQRENLILAAFSVLYTINIAVSNISLQLVTVPFHQVVRASTPLFTIMVSTIFLRARFSMMKLVSLLPVVAGVGFATYGDYYFTAWGLILTLLGTFLAALKTVVTNLIQTGGNGRLKLHPLDLLMRMSPLAFIQCVAYGWYTGELERVRHYGATQMTSRKAIALLVNGVIACGLNIVSFTANKKAGALTMTVSANCKQVLTIALAVVMFDLHINATNGLGILLTLIGGGWYGYVEYMEKNRKRLGKMVDRS